jgi:branched-chain amino acid transport system permease protein
MFFGIGAYGVGITLQYLEPSWGTVLLGVGAGLLASLVLALVIGVFSLRVRTIFFAMVTLAVAYAFGGLVSKLYHFTGGEDGLTLMVPHALSHGFKPFDDKLPGFDVFGWIGNVLAHPGSIGHASREALFDFNFNGAVVMYYVLFACAVLLFALMLRLVNSPFGRVLMAIRENEFRAEALGYRTMYYRTLATCIAAVIASLAGALQALSLQYISPEATLSFTLMINILLMTVIGGMGTLYGAVIGATLFVVAESYLQALLKALAGTGVTAVPVVGDLLDPDRWFMWMGLLFILSVYFFPRGIVGQMRARAARRRGQHGGNPSPRDERIEAG